MKIKTALVGYYYEQDTRGNILKQSLETTLNKIGWENVLQIIPDQTGEHCMYTIIFKSEVAGNE